MPSDDDLFINDDLDNSLENRLNHVLFGLFLNDDFRESVLQRLELPRDSVIYKPTTRPWGRPDFAVEAPDGTTAGYIEVELDQDQEQLQRYKAGAEALIFSFGRHAHQGHRITLDGLVKLARDAAKTNPSAQLQLMVRHLAKQVKGSRGVRRHIGPIGPEALKTPLGQALRAARMVNWDEEPLGSGKVFGRAQGPLGISVIVSSEVAPGKPVNPFFQRSGEPMVRFLGYEELAEDLPTEKLDGWADFIMEELDGDIRDLVGRIRCPVELSTVEQHLDGLVEALWALVINSENDSQEVQPKG